MARTVTFLSIVHGVATRMGMDPETGLNNNDARAIVEYVNTAFRLAWTFYPWPEALCTEEVTPVDQLVAWDATTEEIGDVIGIFKAHPYKARNPQELGFSVFKDGIILPEGAPATVWVLYRPVARVWTVDDTADDFPGWLAEAVKTGAYAATLAEEGQVATAQAIAAAMQSWLGIEVDILERQSGQVVRLSVTR